MSPQMATGRLMNFFVSNVIKVEFPFEQKVSAIFEPSQTKTARTEVVIPESSSRPVVAARSG
jgi:hypothetical protein